MKNPYLKIALYLFTISIVIAIVLDARKVLNYKIGSGYFIVLFVFIMLLNVFSSYSFSNYIKQLIVERKISQSVFIISYVSLCGIYYVMIKSIDYFLSTVHYFTFFLFMLFLGILLFSILRLFLDIITITLKSKK